MEKKDLKTGSTHNAINKDERISPKATLLRCEVREQKYRWGLSQKLSRSQTEPSPVSAIPQALSAKARARDQEQGPWINKANNKPVYTV